MFKNLFLILGLLFVSSYATKVDINETHVGFSAVRMTVSTVNGQFNKFDGDIKFDSGKLKGLVANIYVDSLTTGNIARDAHLTKTKDFFHTKKYPVAKLVIKRVLNNRVATGYLTINGIKKPIKFDIKVSNGYKFDGKTYYSISGSSKINRYDYKMVWNKKLKGKDLFLSKHVKLNFTTEISI